MNTNALTNTSLLLIRITLGAVIFAHGAQKLFGWFGGFGFTGTIGFFTQTIGLPYIFAVLVILLESVGMVALAFGAASRVISAALIVIMIGAIITTHAPVGFFMNWFGAQTGEGYEFHLLVISLASIIVLNGAGVYSVDALIKSRLGEANRLSNLLFN